MTSQQLDEEAIFHVARGIPDLELRSLYLRQICAGDQALRDRVAALLEVHEQSQEFLRSNQPQPAPTVESTPLTERPGIMIGRYRLMEQIGEGGMGVVFVAEQERPIRRKVAVKVIKPGMDSKAVDCAFRGRATGLAMMDHSNIAKVFDAGTTESGRPYFAMELVKGAPITEYCDRSRLTIRERLALFIQVCHAIQHAHQKGIIHRDIKPSNVLVTLHDGKPIPKVIDFGVAKALNARLTDKTIYTEHLQIVGTLLYMSPEQAELSGLDIDTRSDVYSLGVLLYELLTGTTPLQKNELEQAAFDEQRRIIREVEPPRASNRISSLGETATAIAQHRRTDPRTLNQLVRGDLDLIVFKSMEKDRTRRYDAAERACQGCGTISQRRTRSRPTAFAGIPTAKVRKRNRVLLITVTLVTASLLIGAGGAIWQAHLARREAIQAGIARQEAQKEADRANSILRDLNTSLFDQGLTDIFSAKQESASAIVTQLREQGEQELGDKLEALVLIFGTGDLRRAVDLLSKATQRRPFDPGLFAMLMFAHNASTDFRAYYGGRRKLDELLQTETQLSASDMMFVASNYGLMSKVGLNYAECIPAESVGRTVVAFGANAVRLCKSHWEFRGGEECSQTDRSREALVGEHRGRADRRSICLPSGGQRHAFERARGRMVTNLACSRGLGGRVSQQERDASLGAVLSRRVLSRAGTER